MNPQVREKWTTRLRSGQDEQGTARLHQVTGEKCCLGVLCEIAFEEGVVPRVTREDEIAYGQEVRFNTLPQEVIEWAGIRSEIGHLRNPVDGWFTLVALNDSAGWDFQRIADVIEQNGDQL